MMSAGWRLRVKPAIRQAICPSASAARVDATIRRPVPTLKANEAAGRTAGRHFAGRVRDKASLLNDAVSVGKQCVHFGLSSRRH
jgi:hypothetical protein